MNTNNVKLISIPKSKIEEMTEEELLKQIGKAEYEEVFTEKTWILLNQKLDKVRSN